MSLSDVLSVVAIIVAFATFVTTIYEQYLKNAKLQLILGEGIRLSYGSRFSDLGFWCSTVIANQGAVDAVVLRISGQVTDGRSWTAPAAWTSLGTFDVPDKQHKGGPSSIYVKDYIETFISPSRKALTNWIFFRIYPLPLVDGQPVRIKPDTAYSLQLNAEIPKTHWLPLGNLSQRRKANSLAVSWTGSFQLSADDIAYLESPSCVADESGWNQASLVVKLVSTSRWLHPQSPTVPITDLRAIDEFQTPRPVTVRPDQRQE
jgi:hypothetical protein